jgi:hypothetical protein
MSKIIVDTIESTGSTVTVNDSLTSGAITSTGAINAGTNAITAGSVTGLTAASITSGTFPATTTFAGSISATASFAGPGVGVKIYSKDQSTTSYTLANSSWHTTGFGFYHTFSSTKTYVISGIIQRLYCDCNASEWTSVSYISICRVTSSSTIPASGSTTTPGSEIIAYTTGQSGPNTSTLNHDLWVGGVNLRYGPFTGTGSTDVIYANLKTYNTNVSTGIYGIRWLVEEYDVAPTTMS